MATAAFRRLAADPHVTAECDIYYCRVNINIDVSLGFSGRAYRSADHSSVISTAFFRTP
jgi:hypothetical protein